MLRTYQNALWQTHKLPTDDKRASKPRKRGGPETLLTEAQVLECRARHEFFNWNHLKCVRHYGTSDSYMRNLLGYIVRGNLIAKPEHANLTSN